jgi:hypothetical protein
MSTPRACKWKQSVSGKAPDGSIQKVNFPCRFPDEELTTDLCSLCLQGDLFSMFYAQMMSMKQGANMQEEIMAFLKNFTSEDFDMR